MATSKRTAETVFKYAVDQASLARVQTTIKALKKEQQGLVEQFRGMSAGDAGQAKIARQLENTRAALRKATQDAEALRKKLREVDETRVAPQVQAPTAAPGRSFGKGVESFGRQLFMLPSLQLGGGLSTDQYGRLLRGAGVGLDAIGASASQLAVAGPIAAAALIAVGVAFARFNEGLEASKRTLEAAIAAQQNYYDAVATMTSEQVREQVATLERVRPVLQQQRDEAKNALDQAFAMASSQFGDAGARALFATGQFSTLEEALKKTDAALQENIHTATRYQQGLEQNAFATNDMIAAEEALTEARIKAAAATANEARQNVLDNSAFSQMTSAQAEARVEQFKTENAGLQAAMESIGQSYGASTDMIRAAADRFVAEGQDSATALRSALQAAGVPDDLIDQYLQYRDQLRQNKDDIDRLTGTYQPLIQAREREEAAIKAQIALETQAVQQLGSGTVSGIDDRLDALNAEQIALSRQIPALQALAGESEDGAKRLEQAQQRMRALNAELTVLTGIRPEVAARQYREEVAKLSETLTADITKIEQARDARIAQIREGLSEKEAEITASANERVVELAEQFGIDRVRAEEDLARELARIERRRAISEKVAVGERDAYAAWQAEQRAEQEAQDAEEQADTEEKRRQQEYQRQVRQQADALDKQLRQAKAAADKQIRQEYAKATAEINTRQAAYNAELQQLQSALFSQYSLQTQYWNAVTALAARAIQQISQQQVRVTQIPNYYQVPQTGNAYQDFVNYQRSQGIPGFASGGYPPVGRPVLVGEKGPELVTFGRQARVHSNAETRQMATGGSLTLNFAGAQARTIEIQSKAHAMTVLEDFVDGYIGAA